MYFDVVFNASSVLWPYHSPSSSSSSSSSLPSPSSSASSGSFFTATWLGLAWGPKGLWGSWFEQQSRLSRADTTSCPLSCSRQKEAGQKWQKEMAARWHTLHWCQGHSHRPETHRKYKSIIQHLSGSRENFCCPHIGNFFLINRLSSAKFHTVSWINI